MTDWLNVRVDGLSFGLGLVAGTLFWVIFGQLRNYWPQISSTVKKKYQEFRNRNFAGVDVALRQEALKRAQHAHLAATLFSLDEIILPPKLLAPPPMLDPSQSQSADNIVPPLFPYMPDWPELASQYNDAVFSLAEALQLGANIILTAPLGAGKTVALAHLAAKMARKDPDLGVILERIPIFLHVQEILNLNLANPGDPVAAITHMMTPRIPIFEQNRGPAFIKASFASGKILLLLDGLDELTPDEMKPAVGLIRLLLNENPQLQIVATSTALDLDGLLSLGFVPLVLASWNKAERLQFIENWSRVWNEHIAPEIKRKAEIELVDPIFIKNWINPDQLQLTPLEWTLLLWTIYSGEGGDLSPHGLIETYVNRCVPDPAVRHLMEKLAVEMLKSRKSNLQTNEIDGLVSRSALSNIHLFDPSEAINKENSPSGNTSSHPSDTANIRSQSASVLVSTGLMEEYPGRVLHFSHPVFAAYLAASACPDTEVYEWLNDKQLSEISTLAIGYFFAKYPNQIKLPNVWFKGTPPLFLQPILASRWLKFLPVVSPIRSQLMKRLVDGVVDANSFDAVQMRFVSALVYSRDASLNVLFKQLLTSPRDNVRVAACLAAGVLNDPKIIPNITALLNDPVDDVRRSACYSLGISREREAQEVILECLSANDEILRHSAAISLAADPAYGYAILQEFATSENLLVRRSVVFGLARIKEKWAKTLLEQIAVQDGQYVVRNAASEALDTLQKPDVHIPRPLTPQSETPWLFSYANKLNQGIAPGDLAVDILLHALNSGTIEEKLAALDYLRLIPEENVIQAISTSARTAPHPVDDAAQYALWLGERIHAESASSTRTMIK
jgi:hypothetical protein